MKSFGATTVSRIGWILFNGLRVWSTRFDLKSLIGDMSTEDTRGRNGRLYGYRPRNRQLRDHSL